MLKTPYFLLTMLCFASYNAPLFSEANEPYVDISSKLMNQLAGVGAGVKSKNILTCSGLLTKTWPYPNAQVTPFCYDAETACMRYDLLKQELHKSSDLGETAEAQASMAFSHSDATMKLLGCKIALEAVMGKSSVVLPPVGSFAPLMNLSAPSTQG